jgi:hypothetical protein
MAGNNVADTQWPAHGVSETVKALFNKLFETLDSNAHTAGSILADEIFAENGVLIAAARRAEGTAGKHDPLLRLHR